MGKIVGEAFNEELKNQIEVRQKKLGQHQTEENFNYDEFHLWTTNRKPWLRLCSSVDIDEEKRRELGIPKEFSQNLLAQNYILYGGVSDQNNQLKGGLSPQLEADYLNSPNAYGFNSSNEFGFDPLPGISSVSITPKSGGSLTEAKINIFCHNIDQFNIIEALFLRLKYTLLLEWGHSVYYTNEGDLVTNPVTNIYKKFLKGNVNKNELFNEIKKQKKNSSYNYDGFLGWVTNFSWSLTDQGGYQIEITAISLGDVVESFKINSSLPNTPNSSPIVDESPPSVTTNDVGLNIESNRLGLDINSLSPSAISNTLLAVDQNEKAYTILQKVLLSFKNQVLINSTIGDQSFINGKDISSSTINTNYKLGIDNIEDSQIFTQKEIIKITGYKNYAYMKLGTLLRIIKDLIYLKDQENKSVNNFDFNYDDNFCFNPENYLLSLDPSICIVPSVFELTKWDKGWALELSWEELGLDTSFLTNENNDLSRTMHLYINIDFILLQLNNNLTTFDLITSILTGINKSLGNITDLSLQYEGEDNMFHIIDNNIPNTSEKSTKFNIVNLKKQNGSFVRKVSMNSHISPEFATTIAIGAQANKTNNVPNDSLAFSNFNRGYTDRIIKEKKSSSTSNIQNGSQSEFEKALITFKNDLNEGETYFQSPLSNIENLTQSYLNVIRLSNPKKVFSSFIPISLTLEMEGLSGMKLFQKYTITDQYLPVSYRNNVEFLIKGINHTINTQEWFTTIDGFSIPKIPSTSSNILPEKKSSLIQSSPNNGPTPNADRLRAAISQAGYSEKGTELSNGGDITSQTADVGISIINKIKEIIPGITLKFTSGNDLFHKELNYNSRHKSGRGLDFTISPSTSNYINQVETILQGYAAGNQPNFRFINEYSDPTQASSGDHFHISWGPGTEAAQSLNESIALAKKGLIPIYTV